jgi:hypothetical protein
MSKAIRRIVGALLLLLGLVGLALSLTGLVGCWLVRGSVIQRTSRACESADRFLGVTAESLDQVKTSLGTARTKLDAVRAACATPPPAEQKEPRARRAALRAMTGDFAPQIEKARQAATGVAEGAVVVNALLEGLEDVPLAHVAGLETDRFNDVSQRLSALAASAKEFDARIGELPGEQGAFDEMGERATYMDRLLSEAATKVGELAERVAEVRARVAEVNANLQRWITGAAVALSVVLLWIGLGQWSLLVHGWSWLRGPHGSAS